MSSPVLWGPNNIASNLESGIQFSGSAGPSIQTGTVNPTIIATAGVAGSHYLNSANAITYFKQDNGTTTNWLPSLNMISNVIPTVQKFLSGSGTYTTPANVSYIRVRMVGGGGGGAGSGSTPGVSAANGGDTIFGTTLLVASGGVLGGFGDFGGPGGNASLGVGPNGTAIKGGTGGAAGLNQAVSNVFIPGGHGGGSFYAGGGGAGAPNTNAIYAPAPNSGAGGGGGGCAGGGVYSGSGGGSGGFVDAIITFSGASYSYTVGAAGTGGPAGPSGYSGANGAAGYIEVTEFYASPGTVQATNDDVGVIIPTAMVTAPSGTLLADGSAISRTTYSALFAKIGTVWGAGNGTTTFNLPNFQGIFLRGAGSQVIGGITYAGTLATKQNDQFQGHWHSTVFTTGAGGSPIYIPPSNGTPTGSGSTTIQGAVTDGVNGTPRIGTETQPVNTSIYYYIRYSPSIGLGTVIGASGIVRSVNSVSAPTTMAAMAATDYVYLVTGTTTVTLPTAVSNTNRYTVKNAGTNTVTINTTTSQTIDGSLTITLTPNTALDLISNNANWNVI